MTRTSRAALALLATLAVACGGRDDPIAPITDEQVVGAYQLGEVNGGGLPFLAGFINENTERIEIVSGTITLTLDKSITDVLVFRVSRVDGTGEPRTVTDSRQGTFTRAGGALTVTYSGVQEPQPITFLDDQLIRNDGSFSYSYRK